MEATSASVTNGYDNTIASRMKRNYHRDGMHCVQIASERRCAPNGTRPPHGFATSSRNAGTTCFRSYLQYTTSVDHFLGRIKQHVVIVQSVNGESVRGKLVEASVEG